MTEVEMEMEMEMEMEREQRFCQRRRKWHHGAPHSARDAIQYY